jgi:hypothetical protein
MAGQASQEPMRCQQSKTSYGGLQGAKKPDVFIIMIHRMMTQSESV